MLYETDTMHSYHDANRSLYPLYSLDDHNSFTPQSMNASNSSLQSNPSLQYNTSLQQFKMNNNHILPIPQHNPVNYYPSTHNVASYQSYPTHTPHDTTREQSYKTREQYNTHNTYSQGTSSQHASAYEHKNTHIQQSASPTPITVQYRKESHMTDYEKGLLNLKSPNIIPRSSSALHITRDDNFSSRYSTHNYHLFTDFCRDINLPSHHIPSILCDWNVSYLKSTLDNSLETLLKTDQEICAENYTQNMRNIMTGIITKTALEDLYYHIATKYNTSFLHSSSGLFTNSNIQQYCESALQAAGYDVMGWRESANIIHPPTGSKVKCIIKAENFISLLAQKYVTSCQSQILRSIEAFFDDVPPTLSKNKKYCFCIYQPRIDIQVTIIPNIHISPQSLDTNIHYHLNSLPWYTMISTVYNMEKEHEDTIRTIRRQIYNLKSTLSDLGNKIEISKKHVKESKSWLPDRSNIPHTVIHIQTSAEQTHEQDLAALERLTQERNSTQSKITSYEQEIENLDKKLAHFKKIRDQNAKISTRSSQRLSEYKIMYENMEIQSLAHFIDDDFFAGITRDITEISYRKEHSQKKLSFQTEYRSTIENYISRLSHTCPDTQKQESLCLHLTEPATYIHPQKFTDQEVCTTLKLNMSSELIVHPTIVNPKQQCDQDRKSNVDNLLATTFMLKRAEHVLRTYIVHSLLLKQEPEDCCYSAIVNCKISHSLLPVEDLHCSTAPPIIK